MTKIVDGDWRPFEPCLENVARATLATYPWLDKWISVTCFWGYLCSVPANAAPRESSSSCDTLST
jgi:hypothetical protein